MPFSSRIYLVGMPGSGKTTLGRELAEALNMTFVDLDYEIEQKEGTTIAEIFKHKGEDYFRNVESQLLKTISESKNEFVMSTGGGTPCYLDGMHFMLENGQVLYIDVSPESLMQRLEKEIESRPKFDQHENVLSQLEQLFKHRHPIYLKAHLKVSGNAITVDDLTEVIDRS